MKGRLLNRFFGLVLIVVLLFVILPSGPLQSVWYGNGAGDRSSGDFTGILALYALAIGLTVVFIRTANSIYRGVEEGTTGDDSALKDSSTEDHKNRVHYNNRHRDAE